MEGKTRSMTPAILVIEDEAPMRRVLRTALGAQGYHVWEAGTKREAMSAIARRVPQAILLDLGLPDGSGLDLLRVVRERSEVPIVIISARGEERDQVLALDNGANDYVTKPFREAELLARLRRLCAAHWRIRRRSTNASTSAPFVFALANAPCI